MRKTNKRSIKLAYQVLGILFLCVVLIYITYKSTSAWFQDSSTSSNGTPSVEVIGTIDVDVRVGNNNYFEFTNMSIAPDMLYYNPTPSSDSIDYATYLKSGANNDIGNIYVRVEFICNRDEISLYFKDNLTSSSTYSSDEDGKWVLSHEDSDNDGTVDKHYYYYLGSVGETEVVFNHGYKVNNTLTNDKASLPVNMNIKVEALQRPYGAYVAEWDKAPAIFKSFAASDNS